MPMQSVSLYLLLLLYTQEMYLPNGNRFYRIAQALSSTADGDITDLFLGTRN